jgi:Ca-activated chloride channel family protein
VEFQWPGFLLLLGLIPLIVATYIWILRRRRRFTVRYSSLALVREAIPRTSWLRRHLPISLFLLGLACLIVALSRPTMTVTVPAGKATIMLALDVSRSMCSTDIPPNRLKAAQAAVMSFIDRQDDNAQIGIVAFAGFAALAQPPTSDQELLREVVKNLATARRTAIGSGILEALDAIAEVNPDIAPSESNSSTGIQPGPVPRGEFVPDIIVVLSDGASNSGPQPLEAAFQAVERGVRVYTIGYGTASGASMNCGDRFDEQFFPGGGQGFGGGGFGGGGFGGGRFRRGIDEETLKGIAEMTGGEYYSATSAGELHDVFRQLPTYLITKEENSEISVAFSAVGMLLAGLAIALSMVWHPFP